jgi:predicted RNase H-like nuclease (RuvC/YqgF family)
MNDMKKIYDSIIETSQKRSSELEASMENQKVFNELYLKMVSDSSEHAQKINEWRKSEVFILEGRIDSLQLDLENSKKEIDTLKKENESLKNEINNLKNIISELRRGNMGPGESMVIGSK